MLKNIIENIEVLDWIGNCKEDPELLYQIVKERTRVNNPNLIGSNWFL